MTTRKSRKGALKSDSTSATKSTARAIVKEAGADYGARVGSLAGTETTASTGAAAEELGSYIVMNGKRLALRKHPTDFSVMGAPEALKSSGAGVEGAESIGIYRLAPNLTRVSVRNSENLNTIMDAVREDKVAHHIYQVEGTDEEIVIDNRIFLTLRHEDPDELEAIIALYKLVPEGRMGKAYVLRVTEATGLNPLKTANEIAKRDGVLSCAPQVLVPMEMHQASIADTHRLFRRQWYLTSELLSSVDLHPTASIRAPEAWQITFGSPDIVIAIIDDGFDLDHPAFRNKRIHPAKRDFAVLPQDEDPIAEGGSYHGTCVASIATGSFDGDGMVGVAPGCTLLPIRIGFGSMAAPVDILEVFRYVSRFADVVNCSFGTPPTSFDPFEPEFRNALTELTMTGGRRGKGLVMVFSAANDDAPTFLRGELNRNGIRFVRSTPLGAQISQVPAGKDVFSGYPMTRGLVVVGAMSSLKRKAGYSSWGRHLTVTAPSNNMHYITSFIDRGVNDAVRDLFVANYRGLGQVAAANRPGVATPFRPLQDDPSTPDFAENFYTVSFGGTSGAAPVVTGVVALMLSVNPTLTARQVRQILMATADQDLDPTLDLSNDPNAQGLSGAFVNGRSLFFGSGKINAARAVERARALLGPSIMSEQLAAPTPTSDTYDVTSYATSADRFAALLNTAETIASMSVAATTTEAPLSPTPNQCVAWRLGSFRRRVLVAVAQWAQEPASSILPSNTLGELAKGTSWNEGQQARLVQSVNANDVYFPFPNTRMAPPPQLVPSSTTVAQWEEIVWRQQSPRTDCFFKVG